MITTPDFAFDWARHAPGLPTATAVRLHPRQGGSAPTASKLGGPIAWPAGEAWPCCDEHAAPLVPVLQLEHAGVPELPWPDGARRFQLLWCPRDHEDTGYAPKAWAWWRAGGDGAWAEAPAPGDDVNDEYVPKACVLAPERVVERPSPFELDEAVSARIDDAVRAEAAGELERLGIPATHPLYQYHLIVAPGTKAGGFVRWIQDPQVPRCAACDARMQHLVTIDSAEFDGSYQRWMPLADRGVWQGEYDARKQVQRPAGLMLGDMGAYFVFACGACADRPIATLHQCS